MTEKYACQDCGAVYRDSAYAGCPECGSDRRIYTGALQPHPHPKHRYGGGRT